VGVTGLLVLLAALLAWLLRPRRAGRNEPVEPPDESELRAAEREVQDLGLEQRPDDGFEGDDWGPGAGGRRSRE
jgi:uncharacterized protein (TIGR03382 family)